MTKERTAVETLLPQEKDAFVSALETIKILEQNEFETYSIVKHRETQEHFLRYFLVHINLMEGGRRNEHDHFLPLDSDDVLGLMFGEEKTYHFPHNWRSPYLRTGNDNRIIPFDPTQNYELEEEARAELAMLEELEQYKERMMNTEGMSAEERERLTREYFEKLDEILKKPEE
jgi:hypothetical protein